MASFGQGFMNGMQTGQNMFYNSYKMGRLKEQNDANDAVPEALFGQQQQADLNEYDSGMQEVQNSGYVPNEEEANALEQGRQNLEEKKPSELFFNRVTGMGSQERMGHMMELFQASGGKVNDASFKTLQGVNQLFESTKKQDMDYETQKQRQQLSKAQEKMYNARAENPNLDRTPQTIQEFEYYRNNGGTLPYDKFLQEVKRNGSEMSPYQQEAIDLRKQAHQEKVSQARSKSVQYLSENMKDWDNLSDTQKENAIGFYMEKNYMPKIKEDFNLFGKNKYSLDGEQNTTEEPQKEAPKKERQIVRTGVKDGKKVVQYDDGSVEYAE